MCFAAENCRAGPFADPNPDDLTHAYARHSRHAHADSNDHSYTDAYALSHTHPDGNCCPGNRAICTVPLCRILKFRIDHRLQDQS